MIASDSVIGLKVIGKPSAVPCQHCIIGKMQRAPFSKGREKAEEMKKQRMLQSIR
jgi:hypothetical protein